MKANFASAKTINSFMRKNFLNKNNSDDALNADDAWLMMFAAVTILLFLYKFAF